MTAMFGFHIFTYSIASEFLYQDYTNPISGERYTIAEVVSVITAVMVAMMVFPSLMPIMPATKQAKISAKEVYKLIERVPKIKEEPDQVKECKLENQISFNNIKFRYPKQLEHTPDVMCGASFAIKAGTSTAIVGPSGSGKSTIAQLISRFYDPLEGEIAFDSLDLKKISLSALRQSIGYVS